MKVVIFAGGVGTRLWPLSRKNTPKQFEKVVEDKSLLQLAVDRLFPLFSWDDIYISTGKSYAEIVKSQFPKISTDHIITEPMMRDVGPAIGLVTSILEKEDPDEPIALLWSDHWVKKEEVFRDVLKMGEELIRRNPQKMVFIAQKPRFGSQNLGYVTFGEKLEENVFEFEGFHYRPPLETAKTYATDGHHAWNLGYFVTTPRFLWSLFKNFTPELYSKLETIQTALGTENYNQVLDEVYPTLEKISFDNAILEKMRKEDAFVLPVDIGWSDVGSWDQLKEALSQKTEDNVTEGAVIVEDSKDTLVFNYDGKKMVVGIDLNEMLVINTEDVLLVCPKDSVPKIKKIVESLAGTEYEKLT